MTAFSATITHDPAGTAGTITLDDSSNATRVTSRKYHRVENHPATVVLTLYNEYVLDTANLLHADYAGWSAGTGALALGDAINYSMSPTSLADNTEGASTEYFYGRITDIRSLRPNLIEVTARDMLYRYEQVEYAQTIYTSRADRTTYPVEFLSTAPHIGKFCANGVSTTGAYPGTEFGILTDDTVATYGLDITDDGTNDVAMAEGDKLAQPFCAEHDAIYAFGYWHSVVWDGSATDPNVVRFSIQADNGSNRPDGTEIYAFEVEDWNTLSTYWDEYYWNDGYSGGWAPVMDDPVSLTRGRKYWLVTEFKSTDASYPGSMNMRRDSGGTYLGGQSSAVCWFWDDSGSAWSSLAGNASMFMLGGTYTEIPGSDYEYYYDGAEGNLVVNKYSGTMPMANTGVAQFDAALWSEYDKRARCSYFYSHKDLDAVLERIVEIDTAIIGVKDAYADFPIPVYRTSGKNLGDCLRELCDLYGYNAAGLGTYYQMTMYAYRSGGTNYVAWGRRYTTADIATGIMADGESGVSDTYARIISTDLRKTSTRRPGTVRVVGKASDGTPLVATRNDRTLAGSYHDQIGLANVRTITDDSLGTLALVNDTAWAALDTLSQDVYEGTITVSGCFPQLFDTTDFHEGSGKIIDIYYKPAGLYDEPFKVTAIETDGYQTIISVTNAPDIASNAIRRLANTSRQSEAFRSDLDTPETYHVYVYKAYECTDSTCFVQLSAASGTAITGHTRVAATQLTVPNGVTDYDAYVYYAVIEPDNGYGTVQTIDLYAAATGGSPLCYHTFDSDSTARRQFYKAKNMRVIVEFHTLKG